MSQLRIIAGKWRSRKISFTAIPGVRPTLDRVRETLFNWLAPIIQGTKCLDCFAGSGALGFEALSRGAAHVTMIDTSFQVINKLKENAKILGTDEIDFICTSFPNRFITNENYEIIFLDPPFHKNIIEKCIQWIDANESIKIGTIVYIECESSLTQLPIPMNWKILKSQNVGQTNFYLVQKN